MVMITVAVLKGLLIAVGASKVPGPESCPRGLPDVILSSTSLGSTVVGLHLPP